VVNGSYEKDHRYASDPDNWVWSRQGAVAMHRPDQWGYLQFSSSPVNTTSYIIDPLWSSQQALMQIYYAQGVWYQSNEGLGRYSTNLTQLGLPLLANRTCLDNVPIIESEYHDWRASIRTVDRLGEHVTLQIRHDRLTRVIHDAPG
jgi:hypothetical protein